MTLAKKKTTIWKLDALAEKIGGTQMCQKPVFLIDVPVTS